MRIVTANNYYYLRGGSERVLFDEERLLVANGHEVFPFSTQGSANSEAVSSSCFIPGPSTERSSTAQKVRAAASVIHNRQAAKAFRALLATYRPDIVHAHNIYGGVTTAVLLEAAERGIPSVMTAHDTKLVCASYLSLDRGRVCEACNGRRFYHCLLHRCHKHSVMASAVYTVEAYYNKWFRRYELLKCVIAPSRFLKSLLERGGYPADWIVYLPNGVDLKAFAPNPAPGEYVLYAGRLSKEKGLLSLLRAVEGAHVPLRIVGDGPVRKEARALVAARDLSNVRFEGYRSGAELAALFREAAFVVVPSECYENAPLSLLEAYAYAKPVLGARIGGIPELVRPGETGGLFEAQNVEELRESLRQMWTNRGALREQGMNARRLVEQQFSLEKHYEGLMGIYRRWAN